MPTKVCIVKAIVFPVVMYSFESWTLRKAECQRIDAFKLVLEKTLESPSDCKEIKPVNLKGTQAWKLIGRTDAEDEALILRPPIVKSWLIGKVPDAGKDWRQKEKRVSEDEMAGWHHWCNGHELGQTSGDGEGPGGLACCSPWGHRVGHDWATEQKRTTCLPYSWVCLLFTVTWMGNQGLFLRYPQSYINQVSISLLMSLCRFCLFK